jgi:hypothetical protein
VIQVIGTCTVKGELLRLMDQHLSLGSQSYLVAVSASRKTEVKTKNKST